MSGMSFHHHRTTRRQRGCGIASCRRKGQRKIAGPEHRHRAKRGQKLTQIRARQRLAVRECGINTYAKGIAPTQQRYVLGTDLDTPSLEKQCQMLTDAGVIWASSSTNTGLLAREFICKGEEA